MVNTEKKIKELKDHIANLEAENKALEKDRLDAGHEIIELQVTVSELESALTITTTSRNFQKERADNLEAQNNKLKEALEKIKEWQMDYVELARSTRVYQIAEQALKEDKQ